jgi:hypothetical protein
MDEILNQAKVLNNYISNTINSDILGAVEKFQELDKISQAAKALAKEIELIKLSAQASVITSLKKMRADIEILEDPEATLEDIQKLQSHHNNLVGEVAPGITLNAQIVPSSEFIPDMPLYYINNTGEYGIKVNGRLISGVIHNIVDDFRNTTTENKKDLLDPQSIWSPGNFIYTKQPLLGKNKYMRHIGSKDSLKTDIALATNYEKILRGKQLAHDLLIQLAI